MNSKANSPGAKAHIDELQDWAARVAGRVTDSDVPAGVESRKARAGARFRGLSLLPQVAIAVGVGLAAYLVVSLIISLLITLLMIAGGAALLYAVFRVGRAQGRREG